MSYYPVFLVEDYGGPRNHHALWAQTSDAGAGFLYHVVGPVNNGAMHYDPRPTHSSPKELMTFVRMTEIGCVSSHDLQRMDEICRSNQAPVMQMQDGQLLYPGTPLRRCQEWTAETVELLKDAGVLVQRWGRLLYDLD
ncbi:hypothetical protein A9K55_004734 [Cordyceps militaris]|uniref:Uncharacterized protein n=1 Tax=Cordyceps militaris TaxID=73501 RepID=A0A2H4SM07_CORMI|nr:hypothetical protein A9K55_004734 [Cordyceps militaris]